MTMIRIADTTLARIKALQDAYTKAAEKGQTKLPLTDQGAKGAWVTADAIVNHALDQLEGHRARTKKAQAKRQSRLAAERRAKEDDERRDYWFHPDPDAA